MIPRVLNARAECEPIEMNPKKSSYVVIKYVSTTDLLVISSLR